MPAQLPAHMSAQTVLQLHQLHSELAQAPHGAKAPVMQAAAARLGVSQATLHRWLSHHIRPAVHVPGAAGGPRKRRRDAGQRAIGDGELADISAALLASYRRNGRRILTFDTAVQMLRDNGLVATDLSPGRIATVLAERGLHPAQLTRPDPAVEQRSLHPNHVWQVDASVCVAYYLSNATGLQVMDERKFYKNKPGQLSRIQAERLIRYTVADHYSHNLLTRYYLGSECAAHLADFLIWCFAPKQGHVMHGVPYILQLDMGSANTSAPVLTLLDRLDVRYIVHERHNSRANGSVEKAHHLVEMHFESALRFARVQGLEDLNDKALAWANHYGATHVHTRYGRTRHAQWMLITADQLRLAPPVPFMRSLPTTQPKARTVSNNLTVDFAIRGHGSHDYDLRYVPGVMPGAKVQVVVNGLLAPAIDVQYICADTGQARWMTVQPTARGDDGRRLDAPVIGEELRTAPRSLVDAQRAAVLQRAFGGQTQAEAEAAQEAGALAFGGRVDPFRTAREAQLPAFLPRHGTPLEVPGRQVAAPRVSTVAAAKRLREALQRLGRADAYGPQVFGWLQERYGDAGVPEDQMDALCEQLASRSAPPATQGGTALPLRAVGGAP